MDHMPDLSKKMKSVLPKRVMTLLRFAGDMAGKRHCKAFVVGGFVRDLIIGVKNLDLDIVVEGNAIEFAKAFAKILKGSLVVYPKFGTATVLMPWGLNKGQRFKLDIASARKEEYKRPGALPDVEFSSLKEDLYRRDFTINAMAISLNKEGFGRLIDFFNGRGHLKRGVISTLHKNSFLDDPTRIFRAVRFEQRYGFKIDGPTERLIKTAIKKKMFSRAGNMRIRDELILMLKEKAPLQAIKRMYELDELRFIHPGVKFDKKLINLFKSIGRVCQWHEKTLPLKNKKLDKWLIYIMALLGQLDRKSVKGLCEKFNLPGRDRVRIISYSKEAGNVLNALAQRKLLPSEIYKILHLISYEAIILILAGTGKYIIKKRIRSYLAKYSRITIKVAGNDLKEIGFKSGPALGKVLKNILYAKIDGEVVGRRGELAFARKLLKKTEIL